ncbi:lipase family protein [Flavobacterium sp. LS1R49]|uniref:Lipase family protein n=1 Tax=Flavobacterium shii TaxID=2987687 RepID=A0A9X3BXU7_9FLAO|nr:lipase family protein [Flavobacterium shii]MCV9927041.1 lipase family protein [Flavobacterium shii]
MRILKSVVIFFYVLLTFSQSKAQNLKPGFDKAEYRELIYIATRSTESPEKAKSIPLPEHSRLVYKSKPMGLDNQWELWLKDGNTAVLCTRGTTEKGESWLANLYAAMTPAKGELKITNSDIFQYELSSDKNAAVHTGYLLSTAFISRDMLPKIDSCYKAGIKNFIIMGHSQGGGISYLLTAHFYNLQSKGVLPADIRFKTYCSAAPKPGNLYFAYDYERKTQNGWAFNVVSAVDWVPQTPFSVETPEDLPRVSPIPLVEETIKNQPLFKRMFLNMVYGKLTSPSQKTVNTYQRLLGKEMGKRVKKLLPEFVPPSFYNSNNYVRTGNTIVLYPNPNDKIYYEKFPNDSKDLMIHHSFPPYLYLLNQLEY